MEGGVNPQSGHQQRGPELDIIPLQIETFSQIDGVQFETTFFELSFTEPFFSKLEFIEPTHIEIPPPQASPALDHASWRNLSTYSSSLGSRMKELDMVSDTHFYFMEDHINQYQANFTSQFEYL